MLLKSKEKILKEANLQLMNESIKGGNRFIAWYGGIANKRKIEKDINEKLLKIKNEDDRKKVLNDLDKLKRSLKASSSLGNILVKVFIFSGMLSLILTAVNKYGGTTDDVIDIIENLQKKVREYKIPK